MDNVILAMKISRRAEAARAAGISVTSSTRDERLDVASPDGLTILDGGVAKEILGEARALWGIAGVVSFQTALLYCTTLRLDAVAPA